MPRILALLPLLLTGCLTPGSPRPAAEAPRQSAVVELPHTVGGVALFYGELEMLRRAVADHLRRQSSLRLQPLGDLALEVVRAQVEKDRAECGAPTTRAAALRALHPDAVYVRVTASCGNPDCSLTAVVSRPPAGGRGAWTELERWSTPVAAPTSANGWVNAVGSLAPAGPPPGGLGMLGRTSSDTPPVEILSVESVHAWTEPPTPARFATAQAKLNACHAPGWTSAKNDAVTIEVSPRGKVARCEGFSGREGDDPRRMKCLCHAFKGLTFEAGPRGRRLAVRVMNHPTAGKKGPEGVFVHVDEAKATPDYRFGPGLAPVRAQILGCVPRADPKLKGSLHVRLHVDGRGRVGTPEVLQSTLPAEIDACARAALGKAAFACPPRRGAAVVEAKLRVHVAE